MILPHIIDIVSICVGHGIRNAVISPGSRSAAISLAFEAHPEITTHVIPDERAAAFIAMGIAQQKKLPTVLICTSGSAGLNYAPAVAEAYYQEIPLIILTADRPPEWIDQYDGQTINQQGIYSKHVLATFELPVDGSTHPDARWHCNRIVNEAILKSNGALAGPVHINVPIREPFYPLPGEEISFEPTRLIQRPIIESKLRKEEVELYATRWNQAKTKWLVVGQQPKDEKLGAVLEQLGKDVLILNEVTGNQHGFSGVIQNHESILRNDQEGKIAPPELLVTLGNSLISKNLKTFLRVNPPQEHWHIKEGDRLNDTLQQLSKLIPLKASTFFQQLVPLIGHSNTSSHPLRALDSEFEGKKSKFLAEAPFGEFKALFHCFKALPDRGQLHLANSMSVRYANLIGDLKKDCSVFCNRGTSGIDGSTSTAVGATLASNELNVLVTGDLAFFYDRNAFWHNEDLSQLRIILLNNDGGGIFDMIPGPKAQKAHEQLFLTPHGLNAQSLAAEFHLDYAAVRNEDELKAALSDFYAPANGAKIMEIFSDIPLNTAVMEDFRRL